MKARAGGGVSTWDVAINPNGSWPLDRLKQVQANGVATGTTKDETYASLILVNDTDEGIVYDGNWTYAKDLKTGAYNQDVHKTEDNEASFSYRFTGKSIVLATSKAPGQGNIELFIDGKSQGILSINDFYKNQVQEIIFEKHDRGQEINTYL